MSRVSQRDFEGAEPLRDSKVDRSKAAFKLDLIETVNADPLLEGSDLKLIAAYLSVMTWPKREAWLSISRARAKTGLSERQISNSRQRLAGVPQKGKDKPGRTYLSPQRKDGLTTIYRVENPWLEDSRAHVAEMTDHLRELQTERKAERRRIERVPANSAGTEEALSHSPSDWDVPANNAGNIPSYTPQDIALKEENPFQLGSTPQTYGQEDDPHLPYPVPETAAELQSMLEELFSGCRLSPTLMAGMRGMLMAGNLTPAMVAKQREFAA